MVCPSLIGELGSLSYGEMRMIEIRAVIALCVLAFLLGRAVQNWCNDTKEADQLAYRAGYADAQAKKEPRL